MFSRPAMRPAGKRFFTVTTLDNGFVVATRKNNLPVSKVVLAYGAGARHEKSHALGVSHMLRSLAFQNTQERSAVRIARESELKGTKLSVTGTREMIGYTAECHSDQAATAMSYLSDAMRSARNDSYEMSEQRSRMAMEIDSAASDPMHVLFEELHAVSFHKALGNSVYSPGYRVGAINKREVDDFVADRYLSSARCLVAQGVEHDEAVEFAKSAFGSLAPAATAADAPSKYYGGNSRHITVGGDYTYGVLGFNAVKLADASVPALRVLEAIVDGTPALKYGATGSPVYGPANAEGETFSALYSDAGIMGVVVKSEAREFGDKLKAVAKQITALASSNITAEHLKQGQAAAKLQILQIDESGQAVDEAAEQLIINTPLSSVADRIAAIDAVKLADLKAVAKKVLGSDRNLVTYGNPASVPALQDL